MSDPFRTLVDVKDVSTDDVRISLELKRDADPKMVMAYLFKNTPLQTNVIVNLTCLIPTENPEIGRPERCQESVLAGLRLVQPLPERRRVGRLRPVRQG